MSEIDFSNDSDITELQEDRRVRRYFILNCKVGQSQFRL